MSKRLLSVLYCAALNVPAALAQHGIEGGTPMTFFVTSEPIGDGGNLGGLVGADAHCEALADAVGAGGRGWRAYLSTQDRPGVPAVNARDRIGTGPWYNFYGVMIARDVAHLHGDTIEMARLGNNLTKISGVTEKGQIVPGLTDFPHPRDTDWEYVKTTPYSDGIPDRWNRVSARYGLHLRQLDEQRRAGSGRRRRSDGCGRGQAERADRLSRSQRRRQRVVELVARHARLQPARARHDARRRHVLLLCDGVTTNE
jgi:hypothetical protein